MYGRLIHFRPPRIAMTLLAAAAVAQLIVPASWTQRFAPASVAAAVAAAGFAVMMIAWFQFRTHEVAICPTERTTFLITDGIYRYTRNPMYLGMVAMLAGVAMYFGTIPFYAATIAYFLLLDRLFCRYEEDKLLAGFGTEFERYRSRVRRWI